MIAHDIDRLVSEGFTKRMAREYLAALDFERTCGMFEEADMERAHKWGFMAESALTYGLTEENRKDYLSDYDLARLWPLNGWQRIWINDKLTLRYMLSDSLLKNYLPRYFYYTDVRGLYPLLDSDLDASIEGLERIIRREGEVACKPNNGAQAKGFHRLSFEGGSILVDGEAVGTSGLADFVAKHTNYVLTEFIRPHSELAKIDPLIHTIRMLVINQDFVHPQIAAGYLRFATGKDKSGASANYRPPLTPDVFSYNVRMNMEDGSFGDGVIAYANRIVPSITHPDSGVAAEGVISCWDEVKRMVDDISTFVGAVEYLGFDIGITDQGPKIMEINSHTGIKYLQLFGPLMKNPVAGPYYAAKLAQLESLSAQQRAARAETLR